MSTITLPRLVGTRQAADEIVAESAIGERDQVVTIFARAVSSSAPSFADELLKKLRNRGINKVLVVGSPDRLFAYLTDSAARLGDMTIERTKVEN